MKVTVLMAATMLASCSSVTDEGVRGSSAVKHPNVTGTVFTFIFENEDGSQVVTPSNPYFYELAQNNGHALAYVEGTHPSLPNYIKLTSGTLHGEVTDNDPRGNVQIPGTANLADQLDAAGIPWRAYMESMGDACNMVSNGLYSAHHNPFLYYATMAMDPARCREHVVDFDAHFFADLASGRYRYMWITPNLCNDMHSCPDEIGDAWMKKVLAPVLASPGYASGGAIFVLSDEGELRFLSHSANLLALVLSPELVSSPYVSHTRFDHRSYVATIEDIFRLPRLATTVDATPMDEFFRSR